MKYFVSHIKEIKITDTQSTFELSGTLREDNYTCYNFVTVRNNRKLLVAIKDLLKSCHNIQQYHLLCNHPINFSYVPDYDD